MKFNKFNRFGWKLPSTKHLTVRFQPRFIELLRESFQRIQKSNEQKESLKDKCSTLMMKPGTKIQPKHFK